ALPVLRLHSVRGDEFSSGLLEAFYRAEGIAHLFTLPASPQENGIAERRIGLIMEGPAPSGVSQVDPPPLVEPLVVSSDTYGPVEGGDPAADGTAATRRSPRLEDPPGAGPGGPETGGEGSGGAETWGEGSGGADSGGAASCSGGGAVGAPAACPGIG
ncbi:unnamed protein product, partial [Closterium sp. NIES-54]